MSLLRFLGIGRDETGPGADSSTGSGTDAGETGTVRRIAAQLERLDPAEARKLAAFAYVLARVAHADLAFEDSEIETMQKLVSSLAGLEPAEAQLVVEIAKSQARLLGGTENYVVTREFKRISSREERARLLECLYAVAAADGTISSDESSEIMAIGQEIGFTRTEINAVRARFREHLSELRRS